MPEAKVKTEKKADAAEPKKAPKPKKAKSEGRPVVYDKVTAEVYSGKEGTNDLTVDDAKNLLGWVEEVLEGDAPVNFGNDYVLEDEDGKKIRMTNNAHNRPFSESLARSYAQDVLRGQWKLNGESTVIGKTGEVISGQHRLAGLILSEQLRQKDEKYWKKFWDGPCTMPAVVIFGVDEDDATVNTIDTGRRRTGADMLFRSHWLSKFDVKKRKALSRIIENAVRMVWARTGVSLNAFAPTLTHAELMTFLDGHASLVRVSEHVYEEDGDGKISERINLGYAAGLCYLFAASATTDEQRQAWYDAPKRTEKKLDMTRLDKAEEFFLLLAQGAAEMKPVVDALGSLSNPETGTPPTRQEKVAVFVKAWTQFAEGQKVKFPPNILTYDNNPMGEGKLVEHPVAGGIDVGEKPEDAEPAEDEEETTQVEVAHPKAESKKPAPKPGKTAPAAAADPSNMREVRKGIADLKENEDHFVIFRTNGSCRVWGSDAVSFAKVFGVQTMEDKEQVNYKYVPFATAKLKEHTDKLDTKEYKWVVVAKDEETGEWVEEARSAPAPEPAATEEETLTAE